MRKLALAVLPRTLAVLSVPLAVVAAAFIAMALGLPPAPAAAGEKPLCQLVVTDAGSVSNTTTAAPCTLGRNLRVTLQSPDAGVWVSVDGRTTCEAGYPCFLMPAGAFLDDTVRDPEDGGTTGRVALRCQTGSTACSLSIFKREGTE